MRYGKNLRQPVHVMPFFLLLTAPQAVHIMSPSILHPTSRCRRDRLWSRKVCAALVVPSQQNCLHSALTPHDRELCRPRLLAITGDADACKEVGQQTQHQGGHNPDSVRINKNNALRAHQSHIITPQGPNCYWLTPDTQ